MEAAVELSKYAGGGAIVPTENFVPSTEDTRFTSPTGLCIAPMGYLLVSDDRHRGIFVVEGGRTHVLVGRDCSFGENFDCALPCTLSPEDPEKGVQAEISAEKVRESAIPETTLTNPQGIVCLADGTTLVADTFDNTIKEVKNGRVTNFAGTGRRGDADGRIHGCATFDKPKCLCVTPHGDLLVSEVGSHRIRLIIMEYGGMVVTIAGEGPKGYREGRSEESLFSHPSGLCCVLLDPTLMYLTYRPTISRGSLRDESSQAPETGEIQNLLEKPIALSATPMLSETNDSNSKYDDVLIFVSDTQNHRIRMIHNGLVSSIAGNGIPGMADGPCNLAQFDHPVNICMSYHRIIVADNRNNRIRVIQLDSDLVTTVETINHSTLERCPLVLESPSCMALSEAGELFVASEFETHAEVFQISRFTPPYGWPTHGQLLSSQERLCASDEHPKAEKTMIDNSTDSDFQQQLQGLSDHQLLKSSGSANHIQKLVARERSKSLDLGFGSCASQSPTGATSLPDSHAKSSPLHDFTPDDSQTGPTQPWRIVSKLTRMLSLDEDVMYQRMDSILESIGLKGKSDEQAQSTEKTEEKMEKPKNRSPGLAPIAAHRKVSQKGDQDDREEKKLPKKKHGKLAAEDSDIDSDEIATF